MPFPKNQLTKSFTPILNIILKFSLFPLVYRINRFELVEKGLIPESHYYKKENLRSSIVAVVLQYLIESGWVESKVNNASYFRDKYVPWITFSAINFLERLNLERLTVVEFGAGASTCYFCERAENVTSFEFDLKYFSQLSGISRKYSNLKMYNYDNLSSSHSISETKCNPIKRDDKLYECIDYDLKFCDILIEKGSENEFFDIASKSISNADVIFIDGGPRNTAMFLAARFAAEKSIIIVDNSEREDTTLGREILAEGGFHEIPFSGLGPLNPYEWQTSFFVKNLDAITARYINEKL
jgi:hypothetical protein